MIIARWCLICAVSVVAGCGQLLSVPMVERLEPEEQVQVDSSWQNMFSPPERLDRTLLLDVIVSGHMHERGVDHLRLTSEKWLDEGVIVMEVRFDRSEPALDEFSVRFVDNSGIERRRERFSREDIEERIALRRQSVAGFVEGDDELEAEQARRAAAFQARMTEIRAATQPAVGP